jgi:hypothetical protein
VPTSLQKPISTSESQRAFNRGMGWQASPGMVRVIKPDSIPSSGRFIGDYLTIDRARADLATRGITGCRFFDDQACEVT